MQRYIENVEKAISALKRGEMVILTDNAERENEGDLICPAETINAENMNFMIRYGSGIVCLSLPEEKLQQLDLPLMVPAHQNNSQRGTPFTISIEAKQGVTTGVSAQDRVRTIQAAIAPNAKSDDLVTPGHIFPLQANSGGVLVRSGHTEGSLDLVKLAGFQNAAVLCEIMNLDGTMAKGKDLESFANEHRLTILSIDDLVAYRLSHEDLIDETATAKLPTQEYGEFKLIAIKEKITLQEHIILISGNLPSASALVRIHSACLTGDIFSSARCDCHAQLHYSLDKISKEGGVLIYLNQEGRGIGLFNKIKTYQLQESGLDTVEANEQLAFPADARKYHIAAAILRHLKIDSVRLLTNNPEKINDLLKYGVKEVKHEAMPVFMSESNKDYLATKKAKLNHLF